MQSAAVTEAAFDVGSRAWPDVRLPRERFEAHVQGLGVGARALADRAADLFLACACAAGDPRAIAAFERDLLSQVPLFVARFSLDRGALDELRQRLRVGLLVGPAPGIGGYRGDGALGAWVRTTAVRSAIRLARATGGRPAQLDIDDLGQAFSETPEMAVAKNLYRDRFNAALERGLRELADRDRTLLRLSIVDGLNLDGIAAVYRVHRATVARWFVAIRARIFLTVRQDLGLAKAPTTSEMRSLIVLLRDDLYLSARRILGAQHAAGSFGGSPAP